jgi:hypothetical protein
MRRWSLLFLTFACGDNVPAPADTAPDAGPPDPFAGMFDEPSEFPHADCTPGSLAGFAHVEYWDSLGLRTALQGGELATFMSTFLGEEEVEHLLTADDLIVRQPHFNGMQWTLRAFDVCGVDPDGTLRGTQAFCTEQPPEFPPCSTYPFTAAPFRRIAGEADSQHLTLVGEFGATWPQRVGSQNVASSNVRVDGDVAFVSRFGDGLRIVSVANPTAPVELGHFTLPPEFANDLKIVRGNNGRRYVITASSPCNIIDTTDPADPQLAAQIPFGAHSVFVEGTTAYLVDGGSPTIEVYDLASPRAPVRLVSFGYPDPFVGWHDIFVSGGIAYLSDINNGTGLHVVDFRSPASPVVIGGETGNDFSTFWHTPWLTTVAGMPVAINGTEFSSPGFRLLDADQSSPTFLGTLGEWSLLDGTEVRTSTHNLMAIGSRVFAAHYRDGVRVVDISNPAMPAMIAYFNTWIPGTGRAGDLGTFGIDLDPVRKRIYVADSIRGLMILQGDSVVFP